MLDLVSYSEASKTTGVFRLYPEYDFYTIRASSQYVQCDAESHHVALRSGQIPTVDRLAYAVAAMTHRNPVSLHERLTNPCGNKHERNNLWTVLRHRCLSAVRKTKPRADT